MQSCCPASQWGSQQARTSVARCFTACRAVPFCCAPGSPLIKATPRTSAAVEAFGWNSVWGCGGRARAGLNTFSGYVWDAVVRMKDSKPALGPQSSPLCRRAQRTLRLLGGGCWCCARIASATPHFQCGIISVACDAALGKQSQPCFVMATRGNVRPPACLTLPGHQERESQSHCVPSRRSA